MGRASRTPPKANGRPPVEFTPDMVDRAKELLGRMTFPSRAAGELAREFKLGRDKCYDLLSKARAEVVDELAGRGHDPLTGVYLFLQSVLADGSVPMGHRLAAAGQVVKLLGLDRLAKAAQAGGVDEFLARVVAAQLARGAGGPEPAGEEGG